MSNKRAEDVDIGKTRVSLEFRFSEGATVRRITTKRLSQLTKSA